MREKINKANKVTLERMLSCNPEWVDVKLALEAIPGMTEQTILHAGPPISWEKMCKPQKTSAIGATLYEGLASSPDEAEKKIASGEIRLEPCHEHDTVGSMTGITSASMWVFELHDETSGRTAFCNLDVGPHREGLSWGNYNEEIRQHLVWMAEVLGPTLQTVIRKIGSLSVKQMISVALTMGDELHNRNWAGTGLLVREIAPYFVEGDIKVRHARETLHYLSETEQFFRHLVLGSCKVMVDAAHGIPHSSIVTALSRNGTEVGIRVSGLAGQWFTAPAPPVEGIYLPGFSDEGANPDIGDSAITETVGLGAFVLPAAPGILAYVGGTIEDSVRYYDEMCRITMGTNPVFAVPSLNFAGAPTGIDVRLVVETGIEPIMDTGICHSEFGGLIGAGLVRMPMACFKGALEALSKLS
jgi:hypothetical protein